jgi:hypothetical protein
MEYRFLIDMVTNEMATIFRDSLLKRTENDISLSRSTQLHDVICEDDFIRFPY